MDEKLLDALRELNNDIGLFGRICFPTAFKETSPPFHGEILKTVRDESIKKVLCAAPRGTAKSSIMSFLYPVWKVSFKKSDEDLFIVIISEARQQAVNFLSRIKYHLTSSKPHHSLFGDLGENTARRWREDDIILANGARIVAIGAGQRIRGYIEADTRPNLIIIDDFESEKNARTGEARAHNREWITEAVIPSLSKDGRVIMIGTVISEDCFLFWAKDSPYWKVLWYSIVDENNNPVWPEMYPMERIEEIKNSMASVGNLGGFYQEYMNQPQSPDDAPFKPEYVKLHHKKLKTINGQHYLSQVIAEEEKLIPVNLYTGIDPASSLAEKADFFVMATVAVDADENYYLIDLVRVKANPADHPQMIIDKYKQLRPKRMTIETVGYQEALRQHTRRLMKKEGLYIPGLENGVKPRNSKSERLFSLVPIFAAGRFYFRPQDLEAQKEFLSYPKGKHDDIMDAIYMAMDRAKPSKHRTLVKEERRTRIKFIDWMTM